MVGAKLGRPRQVEDDAVFSAMAQVLLRVGWTRLSVNLVAEELGITPAALRQRFGTKQQLLAAFHGWGTERTRAALSTPVDPAQSPLEALHAMIRTSVESVTSPTQVLNAMSVFTEIGTSPELSRSIAQRLALAIDHTTRLLERAKAVGEIAGIEAEPLARQLHCCLLGVSIAWSVSDRANQRRPIDDELVEAAELLLAPYRRLTARGRDASLDNADLRNGA